MKSHATRARARARESVVEIYINTRDESSFSRPAEPRSNALAIPGRFSWRGAERRIHNGDAWEEDAWVRGHAPQLGALAEGLMNATTRECSLGAASLARLLSVNARAGYLKV